MCGLEKFQAFAKAAGSYLRSWQVVGVLGVAIAGWKSWKQRGQAVRL